MKFRQLPIPGAVLVEIEPHSDERGFFARSFCQTEFAAHGLSTSVVQCNISWNRRRGTIRGIHFQRAPKAEAKVVRCTRGAVYDVIVDLRPESHAFRKWCSVELTSDNRLAIYVPQGCGHGFQTLCDDTELFYLMSESYYPTLSGGVRWNDPALAITWPVTPAIVSERDASYPDFSS